MVHLAHVVAGVFVCGLLRRSLGHQMALMPGVIRLLRRSQRRMRQPRQR